MPAEHVRIDVRIVAAGQQGLAARIHHAPHETAVRVGHNEVRGRECWIGEAVLAEHGHVNVDC